MYEIDELQIRRWWQVFNPDGKLVEIRLLGKSTYSGYFKDCDILIQQLRPLLDHNNAQYYGSMQAYFTLNEISDDLYSREQHDMFVKKPKSTTTDGDIVRRRMVLVDLDPTRSAGISASDEEFEKAHLKAVDVYRYLIGQGFKEPVITVSGNGWHVYLPCDMPNDDTHNELIKRFLQSLSKMFSGNGVDIDEKVFNPARIDKLIGTWAKKGSDTEERKWRLATIVKTPSDLSPNEDLLFQKIADLVPKEEPKQVQRPQRGSYTLQPFDLVAWLGLHGIKYRVDKQGLSTRYTLEECPWIDSHSDRKKWDSALFQDQDGKITFNCQHSHCKDKTWFDFRVFYEPDAYDKPSYQPIPQRQYMQQKPRYVIKEETPERGKKWLSMSDIEKVDLSSIWRFRTGVYEMDRLILGLAEGEVTLLSGSNACVDCDTEYFNGVQWKKISEYTVGERVLQYNLDGSAELVVPQRYIKSPCKELFALKSVTGVDQCVSENHNIVYMTSKGNLAKKPMSDLITMHNNSSNGFSGKFYTTFNYTGGKGISLSDDEIRVMCAVICDGSFSNKYKDKDIVRINLKKERKKKRLEMLLERCGISYRKEQYNKKDLQFNTYIFHAPRHEKEFGENWYDCTHAQLSIVADEILYWDGCINNKKGRSSSYSSISKKNIDFVQFAFANIGVRTSIFVDDRVGRLHVNGKYEYKSICYSLTICHTKNPSIVNPVKKKEIPIVKTRDGFKYCFTVKSGMLVLRRNGNINITGNSGKSSFLNTLLMNAVDQKVPSALFSGELPEYVLKAWIQMVAAGKRNLRLSQYGDGKYYVPDAIGKRIDEWLEGRLFIFNNQYGSNIEELLHDAQDVVAAGAKFIVMDNLMSMDIDLLEGDKMNKQKNAILMIKNFAVENRVHILLVAHPRKSMAFLRKNDISGTADLTNAVDNVLIFHRCNMDFFKAGADFYGNAYIQQFQGFGNAVEISKNRSFGVCDTLIGLHYEVESRRFKNTPQEDIRYGWEAEPVEGVMDFAEEDRNMPFARQTDDDEAPF